jgi:ATP-binding cassette, subfamily D (ALD), peroxisomal long-chain fatty acid import protein
MYAYKDLLELAGLTTRLYTLLSTLHQLPPLPPPKVSDKLVLEKVDVTVPSTSINADEDSEYDDVREYAPLVRDLSLQLGVGEHLMITGANGVGKTAVARVLAGLWAPQGLTPQVARPLRGEVFVVPQRAYMVAGSLLDQCVISDRTATDLS